MASVWAGSQGPLAAAGGGPASTTGGGGGGGPASTVGSGANFGSLPHPDAMTASAARGATAPTIHHLLIVMCSPPSARDFAANDATSSAPTTPIATKRERPRLRGRSSAGLSQDGFEAAPPTGTAHARASLIALIGRARTALLAGLAANVIGCLVKGLVP